MHQKSGDTEILHKTWSFSHKDIDFLRDTAKSAKNNTSDWKADWENWVFWHRLIKLCCFSHQDCQQKAKHIASIQFPPQADTKWHSFVASSLRYVPFHFAYQPSWQGTTVHRACTRAALPQEYGELGCCPHPVRQEPDSALRVYTLSRKVVSWQRARAPSNERSCCSWWASLDPAAKGEQLPAWICTAAPLPAWAQQFQGKEIHPRLLAAFLKHPVNHFAVFKSKKWNEMKSQGLTWLCH